MSLENSSTASPSQPLATQSMAKGTSAIDKLGLNEKFRIDSCSPQGLVDALVDSRGKAEAFRILKEASEIIAGAVSGGSDDAKVVSPDEKRSSNGNGIGDGNNEDSSNDNKKLLGNALLSEPIETSFMSPRMGKFSLQLHENGLLATKVNDPVVQIVLLKDGDAGHGISHVLLFPKPEDCKAIVYNRKIDQESKPKKVGGNLVVLRLNSQLQINKQKSSTRQLCFTLPADKKLGRPTEPHMAEGDTSISDPTEAWGHILHRALGGRLAQVLGGKSSRGNNNGFKSYQPPNTSTTTAGMPFVGCYLGVNDGVLYPLEEGLLFYKPPRFLPRSKLHSIACGRGGGGGGDSSRYVDMVVQCSNDDGDEGEQMETVEFTNIQREENSVLNSYIHDVLIPAMTKDSKERNDDVDVDGSEDDSDHVVVEAIAEEDVDDDATEEEDQVEEVQGEESDDSDSDEDFEDFGKNDGNSSSEDDASSDDEVGYGEDNNDIEVVPDEFAQELVSQKRRKQEEESVTESEDEDSSSGKSRSSKRLRRTGS